MSTLYAEVQARLDEGRPDLAWRAAEAGLQADALRVRELARRLLDDLTPLLPLAAWTEAHDQLAVRLRIAHRPQPLGQGVARFPAVQGGVGRLVTVTVTTSDAPQDALPPGREGLRRALDAARAELGAPATHFKAVFDPKRGWKGGSAGLAVALAAVSAVREGLDLSLVVATGRINAAGEVMTVGQIAEKQRLCRAAAPRATLLTPRGAALNHPLGACPVGTLAEAVSSLGLGADDPHERHKRTRDHRDAGRWVEAGQGAEALLGDPRLSPDQLADLLTVCIAAANHSADEEKQELITPELLALVTERHDALDFSTLAQAIGSLAVRAIDTLNLERAAKILALAPSYSGKSPYRVHLLGPAALLHTLRGEFHAALDLREQARRLAPADERPRVLGDLSDALIRAKRAEEALTYAQEALVLATSSPRAGYQARTTSFLRLHLARALALLGRKDDALAAVAPVRLLSGLDPSVRARLVHAELTEDVTAAKSLHKTFGSKGIFRALTLRTLARLGDEHAARELLAMPVFVGLTVEEAARRLPY